jgi:protein involved in polysaccharide export with SLBB domain
MKVLRIFSGRGWLAVCQVFLAGFLFAGCQTTGDVVFSPVPGELGDGSVAASAPKTYSEVLRVGELVIIKFSGISNVLPAHEERIKEDGTLTLPDVGVVTAANKSPGDLQKELTESYRKYYKNLVVTVVPEGRFYHVGGQVRQPGPKVYLGKTTVTTAIQTAGDFTEFGNKKKVWLNRPGQKPVRVNVIEAQKDPSKDLQVFPGDRIDVPRRFF